MKTNQLIGVVGGILLIVSTLIPMEMMGMMIQWVQGITMIPLMGLLPIVLIGCGVAGALTSYKNNGKVALICGALSLVYLLIVSEFNFAALFQVIPFLLAFLGSVALIAGGAMGMKGNN